jgi:hypothetical protein
MSKHRAICEFCDLATRAGEPTSESPKRINPRAPNTTCAPLACHVRSSTWPRHRNIEPPLLLLFKK